MTTGMSRLKRTQQRKSDERLRRALRAAVGGGARGPQARGAGRHPRGRVELRRAQVPYGVDLAAAWGWRFLVIVAAGYVVAQGISKFAVVVLPLVVALLLTALVVPVVEALVRLRIPRGVSSLMVVIGTIALVALLLTFAGQQIAQGASDLSKQVVTGLEQIREWLQTGPLKASDSQINDYLKSAQDAVTSSNTRSSNGSPRSAPR